MAVHIRLARAGTKKVPFYRIVAADQRAPRGGRFIERLGTWDPRRKELNLNRARVDYWMGTGATATTDGNHAVRAFPEGDFNAVQSAEVVESQCPLRVERHGLREGSCGDGEFRGGLGLRRDIRVLVDGASLSVLADKNVIPPFGVAGGTSGAGNHRDS